MLSEAARENKVYLVGGRDTSVAVMTLHNWVQTGVYVFVFTVNVYLRMFTCNDMQRGVGASASESKANRISNQQQS